MKRRGSFQEETTKIAKPDVLGKLVQHILERQYTKPPLEKLTIETLKQKNVLSDRIMPPSMNKEIVRDINRGYISSVSGYDFDDLLTLLEWAAHTGTKVKNLSGSCLVKGLMYLMDRDNYSHMIKILIVFHFYGHKIIENCARDSDMKFTELFGNVVRYMTQYDRTVRERFPSILAVTKIIVGADSEVLASCRQSMLDDFSSVLNERKIQVLGLALDKITARLVYMMEYKPKIMPFEQMSPAMQKIQDVIEALGMKSGMLRFGQLVKLSGMGYFPELDLSNTVDQSSTIICLTYNDMLVSYVAYHSGCFVLVPTKGSTADYKLMRESAAYKLGLEVSDKISSDVGKLVHIAAVESVVTGRSLAPLCLLLTVAYIDMLGLGKSVYLTNAANKDRTSVYSNLGFIEDTFTSHGYEYLVDIHDKINNEEHTAKYLNSLTKDFKIYISEGDVLMAHYKQTTVNVVQKDEKYSKYAKIVRDVNGGHQNL